jgi:hypothetical protein
VSLPGCLVKRWILKLAAKLTRQVALLQPKFLDAMRAGIPGLGLLAVLSSIQAALQNPSLIGQLAAVEAALALSVDGPDTVATISCAPPYARTAESILKMIVACFSQ